MPNEPTPDELREQEIQRKVAAGASREEAEASTPLVPAPSVPLTRDELIAADQRRRLLLAPGLGKEVALQCATAQIENDEREAQKLADKAIADKKAADEKTLADEKALELATRPDTKPKK